MRRRRPEKREILPDPIYGDLIVAKFINNLMKKGKKSLAEKIFYQSIEKIKKQGKADDGIELFKKALENVAPVLEVHRLSARLRKLQTLASNRQRLSA